MEVIKIGGTSMACFEQVFHQIILKPPLYRRLFVLSAYAGVTDRLLEPKHYGHTPTRLQGIYQDLEQALRCSDRRFDNPQTYLYRRFQTMLDYFLTINERFKPLGIDLQVAKAFITKRCEALQERLASTWQKNPSAEGHVAYLREAREGLAALGEVHATFNTYLMTRRHLEAVFVDLSEETSALSGALSFSQQIKQAVSSLDFQKTLPFLTGYARGKEGTMERFGRGYSEMTFAKVATLLKASKATIYKEYHLSSADPKIVGKHAAKPILRTNFDCLDELADLNIDVLHPQASKPLEISGIPLRIKNTFEPKHSGTLITRDYGLKQAQFVMVTGRKDIVLIDVHDPLMVGEVGFDDRLLRVFRAYQKSYLFKATGASSITHVILQKDANDTGFLRTLRKKYARLSLRRTAMISIVGHQVGTPSLLHALFNALRSLKVSIYAFSQPYRQTSLRFIIDRAYYHEVINTLHQKLFLKG